MMQSLKCYCVHLGVFSALCLGLSCWADAFVVKSYDPVLEPLYADTLSLDGAWEMAYSPYFLEVCTYPAFSGKVVPQAVPGYWEDLVPAFRAAGITDTFRINPEYTERTLPQRGWAPDTQLPQPYGTFFYRRTVTLDRTANAVLAFEGVRNQVHVWVNGRFVALHAGYSTPFTITLPVDYLQLGTNEITLAVANCLNMGYNGGAVRGLTSRALFRATGGINGHLALKFMRNDLHDVAVTTAADLSTFTIRCAGKTPYTYSICDGARVLLTGQGQGDTTCSTRGLTFWSPENPKRYTLVLTTPQGEARQLFGLRALTVDGHKLRLNGVPAYLRGITEHCYFPRTVHLPRDLEYYRRVTRIRKELGFNFVRFHTFIPPVEYLEAADELGMLVEIESPNFVPEAEYARIISFARRHPSVVIYSTGNETRIDRLAETYLAEIAYLVHTRTDSLFSPMSALRGISYNVYSHVEPVVAKPYRHNQERANRLARFCDLFNACSNGATSYDYIDGTTAAAVDSWLPFYANKPRLLHETCIDGTYADLSLETLYPPQSPIVKTKVFSEVRRVLTEKGLVDRAPTYFTNSCAWVALARKCAFEKARSCVTISGFDFLGDINTHWHTYGYSVGMMDEFYRLKPHETVANVLRYNSPAVLVADFDTDFVFRAGDTRPVRLALSNFAAAAPTGHLTVALVDRASGQAVSTQDLTVGSAPMGSVTALANVPVAFPSAPEARHYDLRVNYVGGSVRAENRWDCYAFPAVESQVPASVRVVTQISRADLLAAMARGECVLLLGAGPFKTSRMTFNTGRAGRCSGNFATVIQKNHPIFASFPHAGYCGWQFRRLMDRTVCYQLEAGVPFNPIIDVASAVKCPIRQAALFEYQVGQGRLLACSFAFHANDPAAQYLKHELMRYAASEAFAPKDSITPEQLAAVIDAPLVKTTANPNRALNPGDPSAYVRVGDNMMP